MPPLFAIPARRDVLPPRAGQAIATRSVMQSRNLSSASPNGDLRKHLKHPSPDRIAPSASYSLCIISSDVRAHRTRRQVALLPRGHDRNASRTSLATLDFLARSGTLLFFRVLFAAVSNQGPDRPATEFSPRPIICRPFPRRCTLWRFWYAPTLFWFGSSDRALMLVCWVGAIASLLLLVQRLAARVARRLFRLFSFVRQRRAGFFQLSIRRHAARSRIHQPVFRPAGILAGPRPRESAVARQPLPAALGMVPHLFRIGRRQNGRAAILPGGISRPWTTTTRTARCPPGSAGTCSICRTGFTPSTVTLTFAVELVIVWMVFLPRRFRIACFCIVTPFEIGIISHRELRLPELSGALARILLLDDRVLEWILPAARSRI